MNKVRSDADLSLMDVIEFKNEFSTLMNSYIDYKRIQTTNRPEEVSMSIDDVRIMEMTISYFRRLVNIYENKRSADDEDDRQSDISDCTDDSEEIIEDMEGHIYFRNRDNEYEPNPLESHLSDETTADIKRHLMGISATVNPDSYGDHSVDMTEYNKDPDNLSDVLSNESDEESSDDDCNYISHSHRESYKNTQIDLGLELNSNEDYEEPAV
jgi:hypothetical protein